MGPQELGRGAEQLATQVPPADAQEGEGVLQQTSPEAGQEGGKGLKHLFDATHLPPAEEPELPPPPPPQQMRPTPQALGSLSKQEEDVPMHVPPADEQDFEGVFLQQARLGPQEYGSPWEQLAALLQTPPADPHEPPPPPPPPFPPSQQIWSGPQAFASLCEHGFASSMHAPPAAWQEPPLGGGGVFVGGGITGGGA